MIDFAQKAKELRERKDEEGYKRLFDILAPGTTKSVQMSDPYLDLITSKLEPEEDYVTLQAEAMLEPMTLEDRIHNYHKVTGFPQSLFISGDGRIVGTWIMGNDYRVKSSYYGGYPAGYLRRVAALFPDRKKVLHLFSGKVDTEVFPGHLVDLNAANKPTYVDNGETLVKVPLEMYDFILADPPYSVEDCEHYGTPMVNRNKVFKTLGARLRPGTWVVWLDQVLPMYRKDEFTLVGVIGMVKSTNHRFRVVTIFQKNNLTGKQLSVNLPSLTAPITGTNTNPKHKPMTNKILLILATAFYQCIQIARGKDPNDLPGGDDETPAPKKKKPAAPADDDEDETPAPKKKKKPAAEDDGEVYNPEQEDDETPAPKKKKKPAAPADDDDEDETPAPKKKKPAAPAEDEDDDDEDGDDPAALAAAQKKAKATIKKLLEEDEDENRPKVNALLKKLGGKMVTEMDLATLGKLQKSLAGF